MHSGKPPSQNVHQAPGIQVFEDLKEHCTAPRLSSELVLMESLRTAHPDHLVVRTSKHFCDLLAYAREGNAEATLKTQNGDYDAFRRYVASGKRIDREPGVLTDSVQWGCYDYRWDGKDYTIYKHEYMDQGRGLVMNFYICYQAGAETIKSGKSSDVDSLMNACGEWTHELHEEIYVFDGFWQKSKDLYKSVSGSTWDEVILDPTMKDKLIEDVEVFFDNRDLYKQLAVPWKRGIIFHGQPGNGKTISIKALMCSLYARELTVPSLYVKSLQGCNGPQYAIRQIFEHARSMSPCLLIFEDLDSLVTDKVRSYFLNEVDGLESNDGILMIGSTNHLEKLDPAISKRPSRFDRKYHFKLPAESERVLYCEYWRKKVSKSRLVDFPEEACPIIAKLTEGFSFAYLKELFVMTLLSVARGNVVPEPAVPQKSEAANGVENEINGEAGTDGTDTKRTIPNVEIPEALQDNILLNMARHHIEILLDDMDNSEEDGDVVKTADDTSNTRKILGTMIARRVQPINAV
ncbi:P-loop containing nucleoside triphosphate hydrolase protein [Rhizodiscina lignyota]|uniref:P-loop containing nucleoside triphosphate hydrolase protein n=1 Tax=Rhizodiscina lignyota TaxID=1504668 RepID=A0A9P4MDF1_9PEZI|nr:P-loop containing nucleoside triphosphate hydrolase protein [Rhizodiscina lignyota]